jgi:hypothetical protein
LHICGLPLLVPISGRCGGGHSTRSSGRPGGRRPRRKFPHPELAPARAYSLPSPHHQPWRLFAQPTLSAMEASCSDVAHVIIESPRARTSPTSPAMEASLVLRPRPCHVGYRDRSLRSELVVRNLCTVVPMLAFRSHLPTWPPDPTGQGTPGTSTCIVRLI